MEAAASENSYSKEIFCIDVKKEKEGTTPSCIGVFFSLKSLCGGGVPFSHPSLGLSVFFLSFFGVFFTPTNSGSTGAPAFLFEKEIHLSLSALQSYSSP